MPDILQRRDGRVLRDIPKVTGAVNEKIEPLVRNNKEPVAHDGFSTILKCRWCGGKVRELYIPQLKDGRDGKPREIVYNYEPCSECKKKWANMVVIIEITENEPYPDCLPIDSTKSISKTTPSEDLEETVYFYPTGRHVGITEAAAKEGINDEAKNGTVYYMEDAMFEDIFGETFKK